MTLFKKLSLLNPPIFKSAEDPVILEDQIRDWDKLFDATGCPAPQKVDSASFYLKKDVDTWWSTVKEGLMAQLELRSIQGRFYHEDIRHQKFTELAKLMQGNMTVAEYAKKFSELSQFAATMVLDKRLKTQKFEEGLSFKPQRRMRIWRYNFVHLTRGLQACFQSILYHGV